MVNNLHIHPRGNPKPHVTIYWPVQAITRIFNLIISIRYIINICHHEVLTGFYLQLIFSVFIKSCWCIFYFGMSRDGGFGGLVVSMLASGTQDRGFDPGRSRRIFSGEKIHSMPSLGGK